MTDNIQEDFAYIILHKPVEDNISTDSSAILDEIRLYISQIRIYETDIEFMKYLLHLVIVAQIKQIKELNEIVKSTSLANTLLQILIDINSPENDELIVVTAILCAIGALDQVKLLAQNEDCLFGEDFIVWAELYKNQEEIQVALQQLQNAKTQINNNDNNNTNDIINNQIDNDENSNKDQAISLDKYISQQDQFHQQLIRDPLNSEKEENSQYDSKRHQFEIEENVILKPVLLGQVFEKKVFRVKNKFIDSINSRRFGFIAAEDEIMNNIPVPGKNFRAITYDEKDGVIRLGWLEVFRWIPSSSKKRKITFELDLQDSIPQTAIRIFYGKEESPILFVNVPKQLKIYLAYDNLPGTKYKNKIFEIPKPSQKKTIAYEKVIDYNSSVSYQNIQEIRQQKVDNLNDKEIEIIFDNQNLETNFEFKKGKEKEIKTMFHNWNLEMNLEIQKENDKENKTMNDNQKSEMNFEIKKEQEKEQSQLFKIISMNELQKQRIEEEKEKVDETIPQKIKCSTKVFEKMIYRVNNQYFNSQNSRRFGFIAAEDEIMNNIPVPGKNFRAITYDEKEGIIRLGWMEAFRWIPTQDKYRITFELDLRDDVEQNTIRIFHETNEGPIVFVNVTKILKLYV